MELFNNIRNYITNLDQKEFYKITGIALGAVLVIMLGIMYYTHTRVSYWRKRINIINEERDEIRTILEKDQLVLSQRAQVNAMLTEKPDFKINGYFTDLVSSLGFAGNRTPTTSVSFGDRDDQEYREVLLNAKFDAMNMKQLCELLDAIEQYDRIYIKELEIIKSRKIADAITVNLTIATLQRKPEQTELAE
ncbi:MAG: hypothetical protein P4L31_01405 [Candidatus Babeliales bacterium]|nr:hypothetical protein [Candidatus Babeliales bacterium]